MKFKNVISMAQTTQGCSGLRMQHRCDSIMSQWLRKQKTAYQIIEFYLHPRKNQGVIWQRGLIYLILLILQSQYILVSHQHFLQVLQLIQLQNIKLYFISIELHNYRIHNLISYRKVNYDIRKPQSYYLLGGAQNNLPRG